MTGLVLLCAVLAAIWGTNRFLIRFVFQKINDPLTILSDGVREIGEGNLDYRIDYRKKDEFAPVCAAFNEMAARLKTSVERTRQDEESRKELLAGISHDLRSPLTSIRAYVEGLLDGVARTPEARQRYLLTIKAKAEDIDCMVSQLFLFSKLDMAEYPVEPQTFRLDQFVSDLAAEMEGEYRGRGLEITAETVCPVTVTADPNLLRRVLINLMDNSAKYKTKDTGRLQISVEAADCCVILTDDGPGVPEESLPRLFDVFYRSDPARKNPAGGSGLGLATSAMVLPGISGSSLLLIMGVYLPTVNAVHALLHLQLSVLPGLCALAFGVLTGAALSVRALRAALRKHRSRMLWLILGLMTGSLVSIAAGPTTLDTPRPPLGPDNFNVLGFLLGIVILLGLEGLKKLTQKQEHCEQAAFMNQNGNMETL